MGFSLLSLVVLATSIAGAVSEHRSVGSILSENARWIGIFLMWSVILPWWGRRASVRAHTKLHSGPQWLALGTDGAEGGCDTCSTALRWDRFSRVVETAEFFLMYYSANCAVYLPKRLLSTPAELDHIRGLLRERMPHASFTSHA
ncbi:MAG TPA: YcxB family protein [Longimicrobiaceae bacterium]|nr:YcxB family protein [Longimicrobiaceae bacterium]